MLINLQGCYSEKEYSRAEVRDTLLEAIALTEQAISEGVYTKVVSDSCINMNYLTHTNKQLPIVIDEARYSLDEFVRSTFERAEFYDEPITKVQLDLLRANFIKTLRDTVANKVTEGVLEDEKRAAAETRFITLDELREGGQGTLGRPQRTNCGECGKNLSDKAHEMLNELLEPVLSAEW